MADAHRDKRRKRRLGLLTLIVGVTGAVGVFVYGLFVGQKIESESGIEGVGQLWWFGVVPVVLGIALVTVVTTRRAMHYRPPDEGPSDDFERRKAATLERLSVLVASVSSEARPIPSESRAGLAESASSARRGTEQTPG